MSSNNIKCNTTLKTKSSVVGDSQHGFCISWLTSLSNQSTKKHGISLPFRKLFGKVVSFSRVMAANGGWQGSTTGVLNCSRNSKGMEFTFKFSWSEKVDNNNKNNKDKPTY
jgi:hypothetical protein